MIYRTTLAARGQLTLPKEIREKFGIKEGDQINFEVTGDTIRLKVVPRMRIEELFEQLPGAAVPYPGPAKEREVMRTRHVRKEQR
ncbi:MAG: hypothetical protein KatS3mg071_0731 [Meiothermus sp.]|nr:MAG: hypothetical protein KatS3mg071_0731 [Meiothermus sp.]